MDKVYARFGTQQAVAELIGITPTALGKAVEKSTLSVENLLILAQKTEESPDHVLHMAGKGHIVALIHALWGLDAHRPVPADDQWFRLYTRLDAEDRHFVQLTLARLTRSSAPAGSPEPSSSDSPAAEPDLPGIGRTSRRSPRP